MHILKYKFVVGFCWNIILSNIYVRSLKVKCPARIRFQASRNGKLLQISHVHLEHENHLNTKVSIAFNLY